MRASANDDYKGSLSAIRTMVVAPGVVLKEFANDRKTKLASSDYVKVTGGAFKPRPRSRAHESAKVFKQMSTSDYQ